MRILALIISMLALSSCANTDEQIYYNTMSDQEIAAYNITAEFWDKVYCVNEARTGSLIRRRHCATLEEIAYNNAKRVEMLNVLNFGQGVGTLSFR